MFWRGTETSGSGVSVQRLGGLTRTRWNWAPARPVSLLAGALYLAAAIVFTLVTAGHVLARHHVLPYWDHWDWLARLYARGLGFALWEQANEHRIVLPGLLFYLDLMAFNGRGTLLTVLVLAAQIGGALCLAAPLWSGNPVSRPVALVMTGFSLVLMMWLIHAENFFWPFQFHTVFCNFAMLVALLAFGRFLSRASATGVPWAALLGGVAATFSFGNGIVIWPVLLLLALAARVRPLVVLAILAVAAGSIGLYTSGLKLVGYPHANPVQSLGYPVKVADYVLFFLGKPLLPTVAGVGGSRLAYAPQLFATAVALVVAAGLVVRHIFISGPARPFGGMFFTGVLLLSVGSAVQTALGRINFGPSQALASRYAPFAIMFWLSLAGSLTLLLARTPPRRPAVVTLWCLGLAAASVLTVPSHLKLARIWEPVQTNVRLAAMSLVTGVVDTRQISLVFPAPERVLEVARHLKAGRKSVFGQPETDLLDAALTPRHMIVDASSCRGEVEVVTILPDGGARLRGWAWDRRAKRPAARVLLLDQEGRVRGLGFTGLLRPDISGLHRNRRMLTAGWAGYARGASPGAVAYAILADGRSACPLGRSRAAA